MQQLKFVEIQSTLIDEIDYCLRQTFGSLPVFLQLDPISQLILSLIGARTRGEVSLETFERLRNRFENWTALLNLSEDELTSCLIAVTYAERKSAQLHQALRFVVDWRGSLQLKFLETWQVEDAQTWLKRLPGVGPKVSAAVLNFSTLRKRALVVDCHHFRVAKRFGLLRRNTPFTSAQRVLMNQHIPDVWTADDLDAHHSFMKRLGQAYCHAQKPLCWLCPLRNLCPTGRSGACADDRYAYPDEAEGGDERIVKRP